MGSGVQGSFWFSRATESSEDRGVWAGRASAASLEGSCAMKVL